MARSLASPPGAQGPCISRGAGYSCGCRALSVVAARVSGLSRAAGLAFHWHGGYGSIYGLLHASVHM